MPGIRFEAIKPKRTVIPVEGLQVRVDRELRDFGGDVIREMSKYPPQLPWKHGEPKSGPRRGGRRTGKYGQNWRFGNVRPGLVEVINQIPYAVPVGGPKDGPKGKRQARAMAARGWPNITDVADRIWAKHRPAIQRVISVTR
jgi:hypothetical protein